MSIYNDVLCLCYGSKLVILTSRFGKQSQQKTFSVSKKIQLEDENQIVTSCLCFQISGGTNYVDWTCISIGISTGHVKFFTENGSLLYDKELHNESVLNMRLIGEELMIFFPSCIIVYNAAHLVSLLKSLKEMFNRAKTAKIDLMDKDFMLTYKKWDYKSKETLVSDALMVSQQRTNLFDHLLTESLELGFTKKYRLTPYQSSHVVSCGSNPFLNFHSAREGFKQQGVLTDVAKAVVNKITSRLPAWLTGAPATQDTNRSEMPEIVSEILYPRHDVIDYQRTGCNIWLSPLEYQLVAVSDTLGRIMLIDLEKGIPIRMWKGYRDAQCGFIEVKESKQRKENNEGRRKGLFLIIYAPRKAIIEIWCLEKGPKVATFQCSKNGFLIYNNHYDSSHHHYHGHKLKHAKMLSCLFFDSNDNTIKSFFIPFHCILSEDNSKSAEDFHQLKRLKINLRNMDLHDTSVVQSGIIEPCGKIQTPEIKLKCLELMINCKKIQPKILNSIIENYETFQEEEAPTDKGEIQDQIYKDQLAASCDNLKSLIECFVKATTCDDEEYLKNETIELMENEYMTMQRVIELMTINRKNNSSSTSKSVSFQENKDSEESLMSFLTCFVVTNKNEILFNPDHLQSAYEVIGNVLFSNVWKEKLSAVKLQRIFELSRISCEDIIKSFLHFYLNQNIDFSIEDNVLADMTKFKSILSEVSAFAGEKASYAYNSICIFWQDVREYLLESNNPINALLAAMVCKMYALQQQDENQDEKSFQLVTQEECQWVLLSEKLNDVAVLSIFVSHFGGTKTRYDVPNISLKKILNEGKGIISEIVALWLIGVNLPIDLIYKNSLDENIESSEERDVIKKLEILKIHFPFSLHPSMILSHVIWNTMSHWSKNLSEMHFLKSGMEYLNLFKEDEFHLKHGLCVMLWNANFKIPLKATQKLINKTGRLPKEKLCLQNTMIPDFLMPQFLEQTLIFIEHFQNSKIFPKLEFKCEEILVQGTKEQSSLCELILQQAGGNDTLLGLHYEMVSVLQLIAFLNIKYTKPFHSLFDEMTNESFFADINKSLTYILPKPDEIRQNTRIFFLKKAISCTIDLIVECGDQIYFDDHHKWIGKIKRLANIWKLDLNILERHHVNSFKLFSFL